VGWVSLVLAGAAILLAALRTVPAAVRLGARTDSSRQQSELAESIGRDHVFCAAAIVALVALEAVVRPTTRLPLMRYLSNTGARENVVGH